MPPLLIFFVGMAAFIAFCVAMAKLYPTAKRQPEVASEQELVGVGPESVKVDKDPSVLQG